MTCAGYDFGFVYKNLHLAPRLSCIDKQNGGTLGTAAGLLCAVLLMSEFVSPRYTKVGVM